MKYEINTTKILEELEELKKTKEEYETIISSFYSTLENCSSFWNDNIAMRFYNKIEENKIFIQTQLISINDKYEVLKYIYEQYKEIGNDIKINMNSKEQIILKLNQVINRTSNIIKKYNYLSTYFCPTEAYYLRLEKNKLQKIYNDALTIKNNIVNIFLKIKEIETNVDLKLSKITHLKIEELTETDYI